MVYKMNKSFAISGLKRALNNCVNFFLIYLVCVLHLGTASAQSVKKNAGLLQTPAVVSAPTKRIALIIGNHQYQRLSKLPNAGRDADAMAVALKAAGFTPTIAKDLSYTAMVEVVAQFLKTINKGDEVVVFFSGHGVQIPKQGGYLLPIDVSTTSASKVDKTAYELETLMAEVAEANPAFSLFIVDACRDNPFATKGVGTGFINPEAAQGQIVLFAASRNQQALERLSDDDKDPNGVFTREFIKRMKTPGLEISDLMKEVQNSVEKLADKVGHKQRPAIVNEARGNFYFFGPTTVQVNAANATAPDALELQFWQSTEKQNTKEAYLAYKKRYARGQFVDLSESALARIAKEEAALAVQMPRPVATPPAAPQPAPVIVAALVTTVPQVGQAAPASPPAIQAATLLHGRYLILAEGSEVKDVQTGLVWARCSMGQSWDGKTCTGEARKFTFDEAQGIAGKGWRVPTVRELLSLVYCSTDIGLYSDDLQDGLGRAKSGCLGSGYVHPTIRSNVFPGTGSEYWSSSPSDGNRGLTSSQGVVFNSGFVAGFIRSGAVNVRLLRASQ